MRAVVGLARRCPSALGAILFDAGGRAKSVRSTSTFKPGRGTGDAGKSSLFNNERRWKSDPVFEALGDLDELSSHLGVCREQLSAGNSAEEADLLERVQSCLQDLASHVATPASSSSSSRVQLTEFDVANVDWLNAQIDVYGSRAPALRQFILPGGGPTAAQIHLARAVTRRAERRVAALLQENAVSANSLRFLNRLSDLLFVLARFVCLSAGGVEKIYRRPINNNNNNKKKEK